MPSPLRRPLAQTPGISVSFVAVPGSDWPNDSRSAKRFGITPDYRGSFTGIRVARTQ